MQTPVLTAMLVISGVVASGCDFVVHIEVKNQGTVPIRIQVNGTQWGVVQPGETARPSPGIHQDLHKVRIEAVDDPTSAFEREFSRRRGYYVFVVVTGPPLNVDVTTKEY